MKLILAHSSSAQSGTCPYRLLDQQGHPIAWANDFLDAQYIRQLSMRSVRAYAYDLRPDGTVGEGVRGPAQPPGEQRGVPAADDGPGGIGQDVREQDR